VTGPRRPVEAFLFSLVGGLLILVEGVLFLAVGSVVGSAGYAGASVFIGSLGALASLLGFVVLLVAVGLVFQPAAHRGFGLTILVLSLASLLVGGGFYLGGVLGVVGGVLAIVFDASSFARGRPTLSTGPSDRTCARCGKLFAGDGRACPFCRAAV
jgi:hypothetical protein